MLRPRRGGRAARLLPERVPDRRHPTPMLHLVVDRGWTRAPRSRPTTSESGPLSGRGVRTFPVRHRRQLRPDHRARLREPTPRCCSSVSPRTGVSRPSTTRSSCGNSDVGMSASRSRMSTNTQLISTRATWYSTVPSVSPPSPRSASIASGRIWSRTLSVSRRTSANADSQRPTSGSATPSGRSRTSRNRGFDDISPRPGTRPGSRGSARCGPTRGRSGGTPSSWPTRPGRPARGRG